MTNIITEARELCSRATPGPWDYDGMHNEVHCHEDYFLIVSELRESPHEELLDEFGHTYNPNFALIARSRTLIPELADALEKTQEQNKQLLREVSNLAAESVKRDVTLARLEAEVERTISATRWIPVTERLPEKPSGSHLGRVYRDWYLVCLASGCIMSLAFEFATSKWHPAGSPVTHWLPLPEPPQKGD